MKERPILFSAEMTRVILSGAKTQTRRVVKRVPDANGTSFTAGVLLGVGDWWSMCPYGVPGDRLWVRESLRVNEQGEWCYAENGAVVIPPHSTEQLATLWGPAQRNVRPSIHMPRWASRLTLEITDVRVERLQDIGEEDACAEGVAGDGPVGNMRVWSKMGRYRYQFADLWDAINGKRATWASNPWVFVVAFRKVCP
jgi:hypothetical protein